jgi:flavin-binding protein dodecin
MQRTVTLVFCAVAIIGCGDGVYDTAPVDAATDAAFDAADDVQAFEVQEDVAPAGWTPSNVSELYGAWENNDDGTLRRYEFRFIDHDFLDMSATTPAYRLYKGPVDDALLIERGALTLQYGPQLQTTPVWAQDQAAIGQSRKVAFVPASDPDTFALEVVPGVARVFTKVATYKFP